MPAARIFLRLIADLVVYLGLLIRPRKAVAAENLFLRRQLALHQERKVDPRRIDRTAKMGLRYTQFHSTALCSATRAALITGKVGNK